jgi:hypothetical protein
LFFLCDRRIALFCSGYSTTAQHVWMNNPMRRKLSTIRPDPMRLEYPQVRQRISG